VQMNLGKKVTKFATGTYVIMVYKIVEIFRQ
jgi:hypothetical protein